MDDLSQKPTARPLPTRVIPPGSYFDPDVYQKEAAEIFSKCWMFVGFTDDLGQADDFITAEIAGTSVVVQNFGGELRALHNVCTHRFSKLQLEPCGNRKLNCPFHGWTFNRDGALIGVPGNAEFFGFDKAAKEKLALKRFEVATRGRFVFVRLTPGGPSLDEFLGDYGPVLDHFSALYTDRIAEDTIPWASNWKIGVETVLEIYHVEATHPETFKKYAKKVWICSYEKEHSRGVGHLSDSSAAWWESVQAKLALPRSEQFQNYDHFFIFPNLAIGLNNGYLLSVQTYDPKGVDACGLHFRLFLGETGKPQTRGGAVRKAVEENLTGFNVTVLNEDRVVGEACHAGAKQMAAPAVMGWCEERIHAFHAAWFDYMGREKP
jgi:choline monooxygenase